MTKYLIGIDVGTTGTKSMLISETGEIISHAYAGYTSETPENGWFEQSAEDLWRAVVDTVREVTSNRNVAENTVAISLSTQGGTLIPVDRDFHPLHPAIVWNDQRCTRQREQFAEKFGSEYLYRKSGWGMMNGLNALQIAWLRENRPEICNSTAMFLSVPDFVSARMTGRAVVDISNVGINQLADIQAGAYDEGILDWLGISQNQLAKIVPSGTTIGTLLPAVAAELGLNESVLLISGAHDQYAGMLGAGIVESGELLIGTGTAWALTMLSDAPDFDSGLAQSVSATGNWGSLAAISSGGICLDWFRKSIAGNEEEALSYDEINAAIQRKPSANPPLFFPYFTGGPFPLNDSSCKAAFVGLDLSHDRIDLARAVMEGVALQSAWGIETFSRKTPIRKIKLSGGAAKSAPWMQLVADLVGRPIHALEVKDLPCVGAAILAGVGSGLFPSFEAGVQRINLKEICYLPDPAQAECRQNKYERFVRFAENLRGI